nr:LysR family transcriptional regulator [Streptomyces coryli]
MRDIEIFLTLAEELHFGRTAERLHLTQARVSQSIAKQERRIGAALFERTSRKVELTPIGAQLVGDLKPVRRALQESLERAELAAQGNNRRFLRLGMVGWNVAAYRPYLDDFESRLPGTEVVVRSVPFGDPFAALRAGEADVTILWEPVREPDLVVGPVIATEPVVLGVNSSHPLAAKDTVSIEDLAGETVMGGAAPDYWRAALVPFHTPGGRQIPIGPIVTTVEQMIPVLATGEAMSPMGSQSIEYLPHPGVTYVPIHDAEPLRWALVWSAAAETEAVRTLADVVRERGPLALPMKTGLAGGQISEEDVPGDVESVGLPLPVRNRHP